MAKKKSTTPTDTQISQLQAQLSDTENKWKRALADYQNLEKRTESTVKEARYNAIKELLLRFLCILDDIEKAEVFVNDQGLQAIKKNLLSVFEEYGVSEMQIEGKQYDPYLAEAVGIVASGKENTVVDVQKKGYMIGDEVLRHALVIVGKSQDGANGSINVEHEDDNEEDMDSMYHDQD